MFFFVLMQSEHDGSDVQVELNVEHHQGNYLIPNMTRASRSKYITYYEDAESIPGRRMAVWELDKGIDSRLCAYVAVCISVILATDPTSHHHVGLCTGSTSHLLYEAKFIYN